MYIVILCSLIALLLTFLETKGKMNGGMKLGIILTAFLGAIHYDYGNDYMPYYEVFKQVTSYPFDIDAILAKEYYRDPGWVILCFLFKPIGGFFMMVATLNIIQNYIVYKFIKKYVDRKWWTMAVFIYLFNTSMYLLSFSMMRQFFVMTIFLGMWYFIKERKWWVALFTFYLCSFVHSSALILLPFAFWGFISVKNGKIIGLCYFVVLLMLWFFQNILNNIFLYTIAMNETFFDYANTYGNGNNKGLHLGLGFIANMIPFVLSIFFISSEKQYSIQTKQLVALGAIIYLITPFSQIIPMVSRIAMYFSIYCLGSTPLIYSNIKRKEIRTGLLSIYILLILYDYFKFYNNEIWMEKYSHFNTIFSQIG